MTLSGWIITTLAAKGYNFGVDVTTLAAVIGAIIGLIISIIDAKYPNTFKIFDNDITPVEIDTEQVLNPEYETGDVDDGC